MLFFSHCRACAAFVLVLQAGKSGLALLLPGSQSGKPGMKGVAAEPQEDGACCCHPLCEGGMFSHPLFEGYTLIKKASAMESCL
jgi:hypothetical protein